MSSSPPLPSSPILPLSLSLLRQPARTKNQPVDMVGEAARLREASRLLSSLFFGDNNNKQQPADEKPASSQARTASEPPSPAATPSGDSSNGYVRPRRAAASHSKQPRRAVAPADVNQQTGEATTATSDGRHQQLR
ncbi:hypothetical protein RDI58_001155 [Solanum bulbocastanum]|uniref:Uncharacterized protein n=1 Tax=Solanum bulbocastanum TaxID=147425 RepID=A0AAN8YPX1_SOLBU